MVTLSVTALVAAAATIVFIGTWGLGLQAEDQLSGPLSDGT